MIATLADVWLHTIDPVAIGPIRWYGLSYLLGFVIAFLLIKRVARVGRSPLRPELVADLVVTLAFGIVIGGRLGYVFFYKPALLWTFTGEVPWWGLLAINEGGMASHGGMIGGILASWWFAHRHQQPWLYLLDLFAFGAPLGLFFGRIANFINGELIGRAAPAGLPWAVKFPQAMYDWPVTAPKKWQQLQPMIARWGSVHEIIAQIRQGNQQVIQTIEPMLVARHPSQLYAAVLEGLVVFAVLLIAWWRPRKPGLVGSLFCISYALVRIVDELWRRPDVHLLDEEFAAFHITRGQWLSVLLLVLGMVGVWISTRRQVQPLGSWRRGPWSGPPQEASPSVDPRSEA